MSETVSPMEELALGCHTGIQTVAAARMIRFLPPEAQEWEECISQINLWSVEAAIAFDPDCGAKFSTFLYSHVQMRAKNAARDAWRFYRIQHELGDRRVVLNRVSDEVLSGAPDRSDDPEAQAEAAEFWQRLTDSTRDLLGRVLASEDAQACVRRSKTRGGPSLPRVQVDRVASILGEPEKKIADSLSEIRRVAEVTV